MPDRERQWEARIDGWLQTAAPKPPPSPEQAALETEMRALQTQMTGEDRAQLRAVLQEQIGHLRAFDPGRGLTSRGLDVVLTGVRMILQAIADAEEPLVEYVRFQQTTLRLEPLLEKLESIDVRRGQRP